MDYEFLWFFTNPLNGSNICDTAEYNDFPYFILKFILFSFSLYITSQRNIRWSWKGESLPGAHSHGSAPAIVNYFAKAAILYISQNPKYDFTTFGTEFCLPALYVVTIDSNVKINWGFGTLDLHNNYLGSFKYFQLWFLQWSSLKMKKEKPRALKVCGETTGIILR